MASYATPSDLWRLALNPVNLFQEESFEAGPWTDPAHAAGTGLGLVELDPASCPRDTFNARLEVLTAGECNVAGHLNRLGLPVVRLSLDAGTTWLKRRRPDDNGLIAFPEAGFTLKLANGPEGAAVTFGADDAALLVRAKLYGLTLSIVVGTALRTTYDAEMGTIVLSVKSSTTATQAAAYLNSSGLPLRATAGGTGAGTVLAAAAQALPYASFRTDDVWTFATTPSPDIVAAQEVAHDKFNGFLRGTLELPLTEVGMAIKEIECFLARWQLLIRKGLHKLTEYQVYDPMPHVGQLLKDIRDGNYTVTAKESQPGTSFPLLVTPIDPLSWEAGAFPI